MAMRSYRYQAARADGRIVSGVIAASRAAEAGAALQARGLYPVSVRETDGDESRARSAPRRDLAIVFRSVASLVSAGVTLDKALGASEPVAPGSLKALLSSTRSALREGSSLADALAKGQGLVPPLVVGMVRAGERGGRMAVTLEEVAAHLEEEAGLVARVRQALAYPTLLAVVGTATVVVIAAVVVPRFADLLSSTGQSLPPATSLLLAGSKFLAGNWVVLVIGATGGAWAIRELLRRPAMRLALHRALLAAPLLGPIRHSLATARTCRGLAGMLDAGMPLLPALDASRDATGDQAVMERLASAREQVAGGAPLTAALERERVFSPFALQLIAVGEGSGQLAAMTRRAATLAGGESERRIRTLVGLLEPALIVGFGGLVAFVAAALLQAVYGLRAG